jgi:hypothetical protein
MSPVVMLVEPPPPATFLPAVQSTVSVFVLLLFVVLAVFCS